MTTRPFDYAAFIDELRQLLKEAETFPAKARRHDSPEFRAWRHRVADRLLEVKRLRYSVNTDISGRQFRPLYNANERERSERFDGDLSDTINELALVVRNFDTYGDPHGNRTMPTDASSSELSAARAEIERLAREGAELRDQLHVANEELRKAKETLSPPDKVTLKWLWEHMSWAGWSVLAGVVGAFFAAGLTVGGLLAKLLGRAAG